MANTSAIWQQIAQTTYNYRLPASWSATANQKIFFLIREFSGEKSGEWTTGRKTTRPCTKELEWR